MATDIALVVIALLLGGVVKATLGFGAPLIALPILALGLGGETAIVVMALPGVVANGLLFYSNRASRGEAIDLWRIVIPSIPAAVAGALLLSGLPDRGLSVMLAAMIVAYLVLRIVHPEATVKPRARRWLSPAVGVGGGVSQGAVGVSLPFIGPYLHALRLAPNAFTFELCVFFFVPTVVQMITLFVVGEYDARRIGLSILASLVFLVTWPIGTRLRGSMTPHVFEQAVFVMLAFAAVALTVQAII
jgi:uncharacterized membrane protein YfcA